MSDDPAHTATATPTTEALLASINELCEAYANAQMARFLAGHSADHAEHERHAAHAAYWDTESRTRYQTVADAVTAVTPDSAQVEQFLPVRTLPNGHVEIHARDQHARPLVVALTAAEAVTVGVHLTAHAAIGLDRTGTRVDRVLPPMITNTPSAVTADTTAAGETTATGHVSISR